MQIQRLLPLLSVILLALGASSGCHPRAAAPSPESEQPAAAPVPKAESGHKHALLVGCTTYPSLPKSMHLHGPANDVVLMREFLVGTYQFPDADIVTLSEAAGGQDRRPTRKNIEREFRRLAATARAGDQVVVLLSGHGSQQPEKDPPPDPRFAQPDGMNEVFLPADIGQWDGGEGTIPNAILDQDLRVWTDAIVARGASLWLIADCCHSGDILKEGPETVQPAERVREVEPKSLGIPKEATQQARERATRRLGKVRGKEPPRAPRIDKKTKRLVAIYAALPHEVTVEKTMDDGKDYGLLTYTMCRILGQAQKSGSPMTYRGLLQRIQAAYKSQDRGFPTPLLEGPDADTVVLGVERFPTRRILLHQDGDDWTVNAGLLQGLTTGTVLAAYPPAGEANADKPVGHVRITRARPLRSAVEPCAYPNPDGPRPERLPEDGSCESVFIDYGDFRLKVAADLASAGGKKLEAEVGQRLLRQLQKLADDKQNPLIQLVKPNQAEWLVRLRDDNQAELLPVQALLAPSAQAGGTTGGPSGKTRKGGGPPFGPFPVDDSLPVKLGKYLTRIARVKNLLRLAGPVGPGQEASQVKIDIEMFRLRDETDRVGRPIDWQQGNVAFKPDDLIGLQLHNPNDFDVYPTLLHIDSEYGIRAWYPDSSTLLKRLKAGGSIKWPAVDVIEINGKTLGQEYAVVIAVKAEGPPVDFSILAEETSDEAGRAVQAKGIADPFKSPLGQIYKHALYGQSTRRGVARAQIGNHALRLISWTTVPKTKP